MRKTIRISIIILVVIAACYGAGRLYFRVTGGFTEGNITSDFAYNLRWETRVLSEAEQSQVSEILKQEFRYLGKGCQSYVFSSADGQYVIKFFKYQRFRPQFYLHWFSFLPSVDTILQQKMEKKERKLNALLSSWRLAFDELQKETGLVYVHLNKTQHLQQTITLYDKIGMQHTVDADQMEFSIQKKAKMLCDTLDEWMVQGKEEDAKQLLSRLIETIVWEYQRGYADNDHALMQNTGVYDGEAIHIDVGQFVQTPLAKHPRFYHQELYNKMYKFRLWLEEHHPSLLAHVNQELIQEIGEDPFESMQFMPKIRE